MVSKLLEKKFFEQYKTPGHLYVDLKTPSLNGNHGEFGAKDVNLNMFYGLSGYTGASAILWSYLNAMSIIKNDLFYWMPCSKTLFRHTGWTDTIINCGPWKNLTTFHRNSDVNNPFYLSKILKDIKLSSMKRHNALTLSFFATEKSEKETSTFWNIISWLTACLFFPLFCWSYYFYATNSWHFVHILNYIKGQHQTKNSNEIEMKSITDRRRHRNLSSADNSRSMSCDLRWVCQE